MRSVGGGRPGREKINQMKSAPRGAERGKEMGEWDEAWHWWAAYKTRKRGY